MSEDRIKILEIKRDLLLDAEEVLLNAIICPGEIPPKLEKEIKEYVKEIKNIVEG